jgi:hypothetical protein
VLLYLKQENAMTRTRMSIAAQIAKSARGQLDKVWRQTMQPMSSSVRGSILNDETADVHEKICDMKKWADKLAATSGDYPDAEVLHFVASLKTS